MDRTRKARLSEALGLSVILGLTMLAGVALVTLGALGGCKQESGDPSGPSAVERKAEAQSFNGRGVVKSIDREHSIVVLDHEAIPNLMEAMAMPFVVERQALLDVAKPGDRVLEVSFGSGAGSDAFSITVTEPIAQRQKLATRTREYVARRVQIDYATYARMRGKITMK